jgi:flagellin
MRIQNNVPAINAHRYYSINQSNMTKSVAKLSSGYRINSAADDAAGLAISEKMRAQIRGLTMASKNAQDGISLIQTAEGGMQEIDNMVQRIRELVVYASNDTQEHNAYGSGDRQKIQDEINQLVQEIDSMSDRVEFNKKKVINGEVAGLPDGAASKLAELKAAKTSLRSAQSTQSTAVKDLRDASVGVQSARDIAYSILTDPEINKLLTDISYANTYAGTAVSNATNYISALRVALDGVTDAASLTASTVSLAINSATSALLNFPTLTAATSATSAAVSALKAMGSALSAAINSAYKNALTGYADKDAKLVSANAAVTSAQINLAGKQAAIDGAQKTGGLYFQVGANATQGVQLYISSLKTDWLNIGDGHGVSTISVLDDTGADITSTLDNLDYALSYVTKERSKLGAAQNRLEYTMNSLDISTENLTAAESRIRDVDMAKEMTNFAKLNILFQASTAMLAQANAMPQGVLQLLG